MRELHAGSVKISRIRQLSEIRPRQFIGFWAVFLIGIGAAKGIAEPG
jgi:hypothetical protein